MLLFKGEGCWHSELDQLSFIICHDGFSFYFVLHAPAALYVTFKVLSKLSDNLINMKNYAEKGTFQRNYDNKYLENLSCSTLQDVIKVRRFVLVC